MAFLDSLINFIFFLSTACGVLAFFIPNIRGSKVDKKTNIEEEGTNDTHL